ncbi:MAG: GNAT family N-acetyltransferase [Ruminococcus sp.]|jgi:tRNA(Arg) A34 adenosine deaminase TadA/predicted GNAT family acetyltransferase|nr:GNAT family N-acetyltransferase [Ruminococcus sp.]
MNENISPEISEELFKLAEAAAFDGDVPVAAVITHNGEIIGRGRNRRESARNALAHAEIEAINEACNTLGGWRLCSAVMFVTMKPCKMCEGAIQNARIKKVIVCEDIVSSIINDFFEKLRERNKMFSITFIEAKTASQLKRTATLAAEIWREWFPAIIGEDQTEYMIEKFQSLPAMEKQIRDDGYKYFILQKNGVDVGYTAIAPKVDSLFLSKAYIKKEHRGNGYFRELVAFLTEYSRKASLNAITLTVNKYNDKANAVYKKCGFIQTGEGVTDIGNGFVMDDFFYTLYLD